MKRTGNCTVPRASCPYLRAPIVHPGLGGYGKAASWTCRLHTKTIKEIKYCKYAGSRETIQAAKERYIEERARG